MNEYMNLKLKVPFSKFIEELQQEVQFQENGGTSYRKITSTLSLEVALRVGKVSPFLKRSSAKQAVMKSFPNIEKERYEDVAKMLHSVASDIYLNATLSDKVRQYVQQKRLSRKPLSFVKYEQDR